MRFEDGEMIFMYLYGTIETGWMDVLKGNEHKAGEVMIPCPNFYQACKSQD